MVRQKILVKFTPKVKSITNGNNLNKNTLVLASIKKIFSPIPAKSPKEVNQISKYFKNLKLTPITKSTYKSYAQVSKPVSYIEEVIKIKDTFPSLGANKIDQVQNIIKSKPNVTNFIQLVSLRPVDRFSQTKLRWKAPNEGYPHICGMYKSDNKWLRYQAISNCTSFIC